MTITITIHFYSIITSQHSIFFFFLGKFTKKKKKPFYYLAETDCKVTIFMCFSFSQYVLFKLNKRTIIQINSELLLFILFFELVNYACLHPIIQ